jgi:hypothetical protein
MTDPTESPTPESRRLNGIRARHDETEGCRGASRCDVAFLLAAFDDRARAFAALAETCDCGNCPACREALFGYKGKA